MGAKNLKISDLFQNAENEKGSTLLIAMIFLAILAILSPLVMDITTDAKSRHLSYRARLNPINLQKYLYSVVSCSNTKMKRSLDCPTNMIKHPYRRIALYSVSSPSAVIVPITATVTTPAKRFGKYELTAYCGSGADLDLYTIKAIPISGFQGKSIPDVTLDCR